MRAVGVSAWIALSTLETLFYAVLGSVSAVLQRHRLWPLWFAAAWTTMEVARSGWPLGGMPWGRLAFGVVDTPGRRRAAVRRRGRRQLPAGPDRARCSRGWSPDRSRGRAGAGWPRLSLAALCAAARRTRAGAVAGPRRRPRSPWPRSRATSPATATTSSTTTARSPRTTSTRPSTWPGRSTTARCRGPTSSLWPENSTAVDPFDDAETNAGIRGRELGDRRPDPGRRDRRRRARTRCSTRASSGTRRPAPATGTPSGTRCRSASTSRSARSS